MATGPELSVGLRIKAYLDEARAGVKAFRDEIKGLAADSAKTGQALDATAVSAVKASGGGKTGTGAANGGTTTSPNLPAGKTSAGPFDEESDAVKRNSKAKQDNKKSTDELGGSYDQQPPKVQAAKKAVNEYGVSVGQTTQALRQLPAQITDIVTGLASGQRPFTVLIQQGGQIKDSFGGVLPTLKALGGLITPTRFLIGGLVAVLGSLALAWRSSVDRQNEFNRAIAFSGNAAGVTGDQYKQLAEDVGKRLGGAQREAADVAQQLIATGKVGAEGLGLITEAAIRLERQGGASTDKTVQMFAELGKEPLKAALKYNEALNVLTPSIIRQLTELEKQRRNEEAAALAQRTFAQALINRSNAVEGALDKQSSAWQRLMNAAKTAIDGIVGYFDTPKLEDQIKRATETITRLEATRAKRLAEGRPAGDIEDRLGKARNNLQDLVDDREEKKSAARTTSDLAAQTERYNQAVERTKDVLTKGLPKEEQYRKKLKEFDDDIAARQRAGDKLTAAQIAAGRKGVRDEVFGDGFDVREAAAKAGIAIAQIKANVSVLQAALSAQDATIVQSLRDGQTTIEQAFATRLDDINRENTAQRNAILAEIAQTEDALKKARTQQERAPLTQKKIELDAQLKIQQTSLGEATRQLQVWKREQERELSTIEAKVRVDISQLRGSFDAQAVRRQLELQYKPDLDAINRDGSPQEQAAGRQRIQLLIDAGLAQAEFNQKLAEAQRLQDQLANQEGAIQAQQQQGLIGQIQAEAQIRALRAQQVPVLLEIVNELQQIRDTLPADAKVPFEDMSAAIGRLRNQATADTPVIVGAGTRIRNSLIDSLGDAAATAITDFKNLRQAIGTTLKQIAADIVRSGVKRALTDAFTPGRSSGGGGGLGSLFGSSIFESIGDAFIHVFGAKNGGLMTAYAGGGLIRGPGTGTSDSIPALVGGRKPIAVSNNEFIQPERAVRHYGVQFMEAVRTLSLPRPTFAFGGLVGSYRQARFATGGLATAMPTGDAGGTNVRVELVNTGTPQRLVRQSTQVEGRDLVVKVMLQDLRDGGPVSQAITSVRGRN